MESRVYVMGKKQKRCPARYLMIALVLVSLLIIILSYMYRTKKTPEVLLPLDPPSGAQQGTISSGTVSNLAGHLPDTPLDYMSGLDDTDSHAQRPLATEESNIVDLANQGSPGPYLDIGSSTQPSSTKGASLWEQVWGGEGDQGLTQYSSTTTVAPDDDDHKTLLDRLWSNVWANGEENLESQGQKDIDGNATSLGTWPSTTNSTVLRNTSDSSYQLGINGTMPLNRTEQGTNETGSLTFQNTTLQSNSTPPENQVRLENLVPSSTLSPGPTTAPPIGDAPPPCDDYPSSYIKDFVSHELHVRAESERLILQDFDKALNADEELGVIEIGADLAMYSLVAASKGRPAIAFQPNHNCVEKMNKMLELNSLLDTVTVQELAVSAQKGFGRFLFDDNNNASYVSPVPESDVTLVRLDNHVIVNTVTLNDLTKYVTFNKAILKMNMGRFQPSVFTAASELFKQVKIYYIFMNWNYEKTNEEASVKTITFLNGREFDPRSRLQNGFSLFPGFYRYWPENVIWVNKYPW